MADGTSSLRVDFEGLEPVVSLVPVPLLIVSATAEANAVTIGPSSLNPAWGQVSIDGYEVLHFANAATLRVLGGRWVGSRFGRFHHRCRWASCDRSSLCGSNRPGNHSRFAGLGPRDLHSHEDLNSGTFVPGVGPTITALGVGQMAYRGLDGGDNLTVFGDGFR